MSHTDKSAYPYGIFADTPFMIKNEGESIVVTFTRTGANTGNVSWTKPMSMGGCGDGVPQAYNGAIVTIDTNPIDPSKFPINGSIYHADTTSDPDLHVGSRLGTALVVGALYGDTSTLSLNVSDLDPLKAYYVSLHAVDKENRYHQFGVHSYSLDFGNTPKLGKPGYQIIQVGVEDVGVILSDLTGLDQTKDYEIPINVNFKDYTITIHGSDAETYEDLIYAFNTEASLLMNPLQSATAPNLHGLYLDKKNSKLYQWNGTTENLVTGLYVSNSSPGTVTDGTYSYSKDNSTAYVFQSATWLPLLTYQTSFQPNDPNCNFVWYDGTTAFSWIGVWMENDTILSVNDPSLPKSIDCVTYWYNDNSGDLLKYQPNCTKWTNTLAIVYPTDPTTPSNGVMWMDEKNVKLYTLTSGSWVNDKIVKTVKNTVGIGEYYFSSSTGELFVNNSGTFEPVPTEDAIVWYQDPLNLKSGTLWWNDTTSELFMWEKLSNSWVIQQLVIQHTDPRFPVFEEGTVWINGNDAYKWDGSRFVKCNLVTSPLPIDQYVDGLAWMVNGTLKVLQSGTWVEVNYIDHNESMFNFGAGDYWFNPLTNELFYFDGLTYSNIAYSNKTLKPSTGFTYYNTFLNKLLMWDGYTWVDGVAPFKVFLNSKGYIQLETSEVGSGSIVRVDYIQYAGGSSYPTGSVAEIFTDMSPTAYPLRPVEGADPVSSVPSYMELDVGTDGTADERREMIDSIRFQLGYPQVEVELTKEQMDTALTNALETFRQRSGMAYDRGFMFIDLQPGVQQYQLTNKRLNHHKIVSVHKMYRMNHSYLSMAQGQGVYGQMALQQMYNLGSFDLISYHLVAHYTETMHELFAAELTFKFNPNSRLLSLYKNFFKPERVLMDVSMEKLEQDILKDRYARQWIQGYAKAQCRMILAEIRGKYASLPGAGGGVSLNAAEMASKADLEMANLLQELDDYIANDPENYSGSVVILG